MSVCVCLCGGWELTLQWHYKYPVLSLGRIQGLNYLSAAYFVWLICDWLDFIIPGLFLSSSLNQTRGYKLLVLANICKCGLLQRKSERRPAAQWNVRRHFRSVRSGADKQREGGLKVVCVYAKCSFRWFKDTFQHWRQVMKNGDPCLIKIKAVGVLTVVTWQLLCCFSRNFSCPICVN